MTKKLTRHGNSLALVIDRGVLDLLKIDDQTPLEISTDGRVLIISPAVDSKRQKRLKAAFNRSHEKYDRLYRRLSKDAA